jgi:hypothetical protein
MEQAVVIDKHGYARGKEVQTSYLSRISAYDGSTIRNRRFKILQHDWHDSHSSAIL